MAQLQNGRYNAIPDNMHELNEYPELQTQQGLHDVIQFVDAMAHNPNPPVPAGYDVHEFRQRYHTECSNSEIATISRM